MFSIELAVWFNHAGMSGATLSSNLNVHVRRLSPKSFIRPIWAFVVRAPPSTEAGVIFGINHQIGGWCNT